MAEPVTDFITPVLRPLSLASLASLASTALLALFTLLAPPAMAESLPDPTRPPAALGAPESHETAPKAGPVLQSVLISPTRSQAVISGETVHVGDPYGDAKVARITETEVVLRKGTEVQTLKLFPGFEKHAGPAAKPKKRQ